MRRFDCLLRRISRMEPSGPIPDNWPNLRLAILLALDDFPEAKDHLASNLMEQRQEPERQERTWSELRSFILDCLESFPGARESMIAALKEVGA